MSKEKHEERMRRIAEDRKEYEYREIERKAIEEFKKPRKHIAASKIFMIVMFLLSLQIIIYSEWLMYRFGDTSALYTLIGIPAALTAALWSYNMKSKAENTKDGLIYEKAMMEMQNEFAVEPKCEEGDEEEDGTESEEYGSVG